MVRRPRQFTIPLSCTFQWVPLPLTSWFNIKATKTYHTLIFFLFHEHIWCYKDSQSFKFYLGRNGAWQVPVMSCHISEWPYMYMSVIVDKVYCIYKNNIRSIEDWSIWRILFAQSKSDKFITIYYFHHVNCWRIGCESSQWTFLIIHNHTHLHSQKLRRETLVKVRRLICHWSVTETQSNHLFNILLHLLLPPTTLLYKSIWEGGAQWLMTHSLWLSLEI